MRYLKKAVTFVTFSCITALSITMLHASDQNAPALTIYNQDFAVVRSILPLDLHKGINNITFDDITSRLEPDSVILRDTTGQRALHIIEQNYRGDSMSQSLLLSLYEGKTIEFQVTHGNKAEIVNGKIIRSGYILPSRQNSSSYYYNQQNPQNQPIIEVDGKLQFSLPGTPIFPALTDDSILKPVLDWKLETDKDGPMQAEVAYVTNGITWKADYNAVTSGDNKHVDLIGWVTITNQTGKSFNNAHIKLMAGDVNKIKNKINAFDYNGPVLGSLALVDGSSPAVTERAFDEYHLYTLPNPTTLLDRETKQIQFLSANHVPTKSVYVYDGVNIDSNSYNGWNYDNIRNQPSYGTQCNNKVWTMREIINSKDNGLGIPLPKGRIRFYQSDTDGQLEFTGENNIDHTPKDETLRIFTGNSFDLTGERKQTSYKIDTSRNVLDEGFDITLKNHKDAPAEIRVVEHLYRGLTWSIQESSEKYKKTDGHTIEYTVIVPANQEKKLSYTAHYTW